MPNSIPPLLLLLLLLAPTSHARPISVVNSSNSSDSIVYLWPLPKHFTHGHHTLSVSPHLTLRLQGPGHNSTILREAFHRYRHLIFKPWAHAGTTSDYQLNTLTVLLSSDDETVSPIPMLLRLYDFILLSTILFPFSYNSEWMRVMCFIWVHSRLDLSLLELQLRYSSLSIAVFLSYQFIVQNITTCLLRSHSQFPA